MRILLPMSLISFSVLLFSCSKDSPVAPSTPLPKTMIVAGYGSIIDSLYYKVWSDSSWGKYGQTTTINGITYVTLVVNTGDAYYYNAIGYAGFKPSGQSLILFDKPIAPLPDTMTFGDTYVRETTFFFQGFNYSLRNESILQDTVSVSVPVGIFNTCLQFSAKSSLSASGQSQVQNSQFWLAKGPSDIKQTLNSGITIVMVRGRVNGRGWNMPFPKSQLSGHIVSALTPDNLIGQMVMWRWLTSRSS